MTVLPSCRARAEWPDPLEGQPGGCTAGALKHDRKEEHKMKIETVTGWLRAGLFTTREQALGALELAHQQWLDGLGKGSHREWLGMTEAEFDAWMRSCELPRTRRHLA